MVIKQTKNVAIDSKKIILIDGHNLLFRMFYGIPSSIKNSNGMEIKELVGFIGSLKRIVSEFKPDSMAVIFDSETSRNNNLQADDNYKLGRTDYTDVQEEDNPFSQLPLIMKALDFLGIFYLEVQNNEADDYIASIINKGNDSNEYIIVSNDSDFIQLVSKNTFLYVARGKKSILYDEGEVIKKYNVSPSKYILFKSIVGDKSDNISGIKGIGSVIASRILQYDSLEDYILNSTNYRITKLLIENKDKIIKNMKLIGMNNTIDVSEMVFNKLSNKIFDYKTYEVIDIIGEK